MFKKIFIILIATFIFAQYLGVSHGASSDSSSDSGSDNYMDQYKSAKQFISRAEKHYLAGLKIKPNHNGINEYLGELYVKTGRVELAKERLAVLKNCNCEEYAELKEVIEKN